MSCKTLEVELENGRVRPRGAETLPASGHALLTLLDSGSPSVAGTCGELAGHWGGLDKLPLGEANAFADDLEKARAHLSPLK